MFVVGATLQSFSAIIRRRDIKYKWRMYGRWGKEYIALRYRLDIFAVAILIPNVIFEHILNFQKSV